MTNFINLTGHNLNLPGSVIPGDKAKTVRVTDHFGEFDSDGVCTVGYGELVGLPDPVPGTVFVVSAMVLAIAKAKGRGDCVAPATGHPNAKKNEKGHILEVPGFVR